MAPERQVTGIDPVDVKIVERRPVVEVIQPEYVTISIDRRFLVEMQEKREKLNEYLNDVGVHLDLIRDDPDGWTWKMSAETRQAMEDVLYYVAVMAEALDE